MEILILVFTTSDESLHENVAVSAVRKLSNLSDQTGFGVV